MPTACHGLLKEVGVRDKLSLDGLDPEQTAVREHVLHEAVRITRIKQDNLHLFAYAKDLLVLGTWSTHEAEQGFMNTFDGALWPHDNRTRTEVRLKKKRGRWIWQRH